MQFPADALGVSDFDQLDLQLVVAAMSGSATGFIVSILTGMFPASAEFTPRHILFLHRELLEIRSIFALQRLPSPTLTVFESGVSVAVKDGVPVDWVPVALTSHQFQASEVWRRVGGALASVAQTAGWHAWMSTGSTTSSSDSWLGMGFRDDRGTDADPASAADGRASWIAYQRLAKLLARSSRAVVVSPAGGGSADLDMAMDGLLILEFSGGINDEYTYLIFVDPSTTTAPRGYYVHVGRPAIQYSTIPSVWKDSGGDVKRLPHVTDIDFTSGSHGPGFFTIAVADYPRVYRATAPIAFTVAVK